MAESDKEAKKPSCHLTDWIEYQNNIEAWYVIISNTWIPIVYSILTVLKLDTFLPPPTSISRAVLQQQYQKL